MRAPAEKIKAAILDPDLSLRMAAVYYFAGAHSSDPSLMSLVMQACGQYGNEAFESLSCLSELVQTDESIDWLCQQIDQIDLNGDETMSDRYVDLIEALRGADAALLERSADTIRQARQLDDDTKTVISDRIELAALPPEELWQRLVQFCQEQDQDEENAADNFEFGASIVEALTPYSDQFAGEVLSILERETGADWLEVMATRLAGALKLEAAVPRLVDLLADFDSWAGEVARWSLINIGTDPVVEELSARYATNEDVRLEIAFLLESFHSDLSVQTCLDLFSQEQDEELRGYLLQSALLNFAAEAVEPARQFLLNSEKTPDVLEVRQALLLDCKLLGEKFPEFDAWLEDSQGDREFRRAWHEEHGRSDLDNEFDFGGELDDDWDGETLDADSMDADDLESDLGGGMGGFDDQPADTIVRHDEKVGRNDPCPCGSGKKYKKCCLHKQVPE